MRSLKGDNRIQADMMFGVYTGKIACRFDGVSVSPVQDLFTPHNGEVF
jgi:hypothetical protein